MFERTIKKAVEVVGIGLHKGESVRLRLEPLEEGGILFYRSDLAQTIPLSIDSVIDTKMATVIGNDSAHISTIEHFLSAVYAYGIDHMRVVIEGNEMPIMDGSAISFCLLLDEAGIQELDTPKKFLKIKDRVEIKEEKKYAILEPYKGAKFDFTIDFEHPAIGVQKYSFDFSKKSYIEEIARARTFGFARDIQYLQSRNLALGASLDNAIGLDEYRVLNPEGLRYENEFVRHKILDAMGDMRVTGYNLWGRYESFAGSHDLNHQLTKALFADSKNYEIVTFTKEKSKIYEVSFA